MSYLITSIQPKKKQIMKASADDQKLSHDSIFSVLFPDDEKSNIVGVDRPITVPIRDPVIPPSSLLLMKSMFLGGANKSVKFRLSRVATLTTSGAGAMALLTLVYPQTFDQYGTLAALFSECRLVATRISYTLNLNPDQATGGTSGVVGGAFMTAFNPTAITGSTATVASVSRLPKSKMFCTANTNWPIKLIAKAPRNNVWSAVTAGSSGSDPLGGIRGGWCHVALSTLSNSVAYLVYCLEAEYEFRCLL